MTVTVGELKAMAASSALDFARELAPGGHVTGKNYFTRSPWRADRRAGSFAVEIAGPKAGLWKDFSADEGGDLIDLIARAKYGGVSRAQRGDAIQWLKQRLGIAHHSPKELSAARAQASAEKLRREALDLEAREAKARRAFEIWLSGKPLGGTLGEVYLRARGVEARSITNLSNTFRFVERLDYWRGGERHVGPAIVGRYRRIDGTPAGSIHGTWLSRDGLRKADLRRAKLSLGEYKGCFMPICRGETGAEVWDGAAPGPVIVTEGPEDAWTEAYAAPDLRVWAAGSLSNIGNLPWSPSISAFLVVRQNDWATLAAVKAFERAIEALRRHPCPVEIIGVGLGKDPNDQLRRIR